MLSKVTITMAALSQPCEDDVKLTAPKVVTNPAGFFSGQMNGMSNGMSNVIAPKDVVIGSDPSGEVEVAGFLDADKHITRRFPITWSGSLTEWFTAKDSALSKTIWKPDPKELDIFRTKKRDADGDVNEERRGDLSKVIVIRARVLYKSNPTPVDIGVKVTGLKGNAYASSMDMRFPITMFATEKGRCDEVYVFSANICH